LPSIDRLYQSAGRRAEAHAPLAPALEVAPLLPRSSITVVIFCWRILLISESMDHHDSEIMDDRSID